MTTPRRPFNRAAFLAGYRAACEANAVDPATGNPAAWDDPHWWANPALWTESGRNHSSTEAAALANVAAQARRAVDGAMERMPAREFRQIVREVLSEERAVRPLRELHARRGVTVEEVAGQRMEVPVKRPA